MIIKSLRQLSILQRFDKSKSKLMDDTDLEWILSSPVNCYLDFIDGCDLEGDLYNNGDIQTLQSHEQGSPAAAVEPTEIDDNGDGTVDSEAAPELTKRKRHRKSEVWKSFHIVKEDDGTQSAKCNHCPTKYKGYSSKKGTSNLLQHMKKCTAISRRNGFGDKPTDETGGPQATPVLNREKTVFDQEWSNKSIARSMPINHEFPLSVLDNNLQPNTLKLQSYDSLKAGVLHFYTEGTGNLRRSLNKITLVLNFSKVWGLKKNVLDFSKQFLSVEAVASLQIRQDWSIDENGRSVHIVLITDKKVDEIVNMIKDWLDYDQDHSLPSSRKLFRFNCFLHILNLLVADGLQEVRGTYFKMMNSLYCVRDATPVNEENFGKAVDQARSKGKKVTSQYMPTTSLFNFQTLGRMLSLREVFSELLSIDSDYRNHPITDEEWDKATFIYECLKVLDEAIQSLSASPCLTMNMCFPKVCKIYKDLQCLWGEIPSSDVQSMTHEMEVKLKKFWDYSIETLAVAAILDPRFKFGIVERWCEKINGQDAEGECKKIHDTLTKIYDEYAAGILDPYVMLDPLGMPCSSSGDGKSQKSELERYLEEPKYRSVEEFDILGWWRVNTPNFPTLAKMALDFLTIPISTARSHDGSPRF